MLPKTLVLPPPLDLSRPLDWPKLMDSMSCGASFTSLGRYGPASEI
jgi:hypothetical protein